MRVRKSLAADGFVITTWGAVHDIAVNASEGDNTVPVVVGAAAMTSQSAVAGMTFVSTVTGDEYRAPPQRGTPKEHSTPRSRRF